ncbi:MAG: hypothetical protein CM15mP103_07860 [Gammaproteobacteria bacterium]|nr:MAG: hypothetical protein CM15mP103_07860 [Gammaproteobacteria bacterium]
MDLTRLYPAGLEKGLDGPDQAGIAWDDNFESWTGPFVMAAINPKSSGAPTPWRACPTVRLPLRRVPAVLKPRQGAVERGRLRGRDGRHLFSPTRALLKRSCPTPVRDPTKPRAIMAFQILGTMAPTARTSCASKWRSRDPGYGATSRMLAQAGLCLARDELSVGGGIWTTASAMGDALLSRLPSVDIHFSVSRILSLILPGAHLG